MINASTAKKDMINAKLRKSSSVVQNISRELSKNIAKSAKAGLSNITYTFDKTHPFHEQIALKLEEELEKCGYKVNAINGTSININW